MRFQGLHISRVQYHRLKGGLHPQGWNYDWAEFIKNNKNATKAQCEAQLAKMMGPKSKYASNLAKGNPAVVNYKDWKNTRVRWKILKVKSGIKGGSVLGMIGTVYAVSQFDHAMMDDFVNAASQYIENGDNKYLGIAAGYASDMTGNAIATNLLMNELIKASNNYNKNKVKGCK